MVSLLVCLVISPCQPRHCLLMMAKMTCWAIDYHYLILFCIKICLGQLTWLTMNDKWPAWQFIPHLSCLIKVSCYSDSDSLKSSCFLGVPFIVGHGLSDSELSTLNNTPIMTSHETYYANLQFFVSPCNNFCSPDLKTVFSGSILHIVCCLSWSNGFGIKEMTG